LKTPEDPGKLTFMAILLYIDSRIYRREVISTDKRNTSRVPAVGHISYRVSFDEQKKKFSGILIDTSNAGVGLYTFRPLDEGNNIEIYRAGQVNQPIIATVKWCSKIGIDFFRVGISIN